MGSYVDKSQNIWILEATKYNVFTGITKTSDFIQESRAYGIKNNLNSMVSKIYNFLSKLNGYHTNEYVTNIKK